MISYKTMKQSQFSIITNNHNKSIIKLNNVIETFKKKKSKKKQKPTIVLECTIKSNSINLASNSDNQDEQDDMINDNDESDY